MSLALSVVIPAFNAEAHLPRLTAALRAQTLRAAEFLIVDDGSTDSTPQLLAQFAAAEPRARVIRQANAGPSVARNVGVEAAAGAYVTYIDADDDFDPAFCEALWTAATARDLDIVYCNGRRIDAKGVAHPHPIVRKPKPADPIPGAEWIANGVEEKDFVHAPWLLACRAALAKATPFPAGIIHEDVIWTVELLLGARRVGFLDRELYFYRSTPQSLMREPTDAARLRRIEGYFAVARRLQELAGAASLPPRTAAALRRQAAEEASNVFRMGRHLPGVDRRRVYGRAGVEGVPGLMWREAWNLTERRRAARVYLLALACRGWAR